MRNWFRRSFGARVVAGTLVLVLALAGYFSWRAVLARRADEQAVVMRSIAMAGGRFSLDTDFFDPPAYGPPRWLQSLVGQQFFSNIVSVNLGTTDVTDETVGSLARLKHLQSLGIWRTRLDDAGLASLAPLSELETLDISQTDVTNDGLKQLARFNAVRVLVVGGERLTDAGLEPLKQMRRLTMLCVVGNQFSAPARESLEEALPDATVVFVPLPRAAGDAARRGESRPARKQPPSRGRFT